MMIHFLMIKFCFLDCQIQCIQVVVWKNCSICEELFVTPLDGNEYDNQEHQVTCNNRNIQMFKVKQHHKNNNYLQL